jgi:transcriptional regulator with XRE-family HTH domain
MDAFDEILARTPETVKRQVSKNLAIAVRIASVLKEQGKTQRDLARLLGKSESEISRWLTGLHNLELKTIYKIEDVLEAEIVTIVQNLVSKKSVRNKVYRNTPLSKHTKSNLKDADNSGFTIVQTSSKKEKESLIHSKDITIPTALKR